MCRTVLYVVPLVLYTPVKIVIHAVPCLYIYAVMLFHLTACTARHIYANIYIYI